MGKFTIWHNPRCSKSRQTLQILDASGHNFEILRYLDDNPSRNQIIDIMTQLGLKDPRDMMRRGEAIYKELGLKDETDANKLIEAMVLHPILIERPIVSDGTRAVIGRPPESVKALL